MPAEQRPDNPTHPSATPTRTEFARALRELRSWSGLTLQEVRDLQPRLPVTTSSDYERAIRLPGWEWVYDFVSTCLTHPKPPHRLLAPHRLRAELEHWQTAWTHAKKHPTPEPEPEPETREQTEPASPEPGGPEPAADTAQPTPTISPAPATGTPVLVAGPVIDEPPPRGASDAARASSTDIDHHEAARPTGSNSPSRRGWLLSAAAVAVVLAAGTAATAMGMFERPLTPPPATDGPPPAATSNTAAAPSASPSPAQAAVRVVGNADDLPTSQGIDLDNGKTLDQLTPGVDTSFSSKSTHLDSMAVRAFFAVLPTPVPEERTHCEEVTDWTRETYPDVYSLAEGRNICVKTDEGRLAMLTVTKRATPAAGTIGLRFITWE